MKYIGHATVDRGDGTSEDVIVPVEDTESLDGEHIEVILHDTECMFLSGLIRTDSTDSSVSIGESETSLAIMYVCLKLLKFSCEVFHIGAIGFE